MMDKQQPSPARQFWEALPVCLLVAVAALLVVQSVQISQGNALLGRIASHRADGFELGARAGGSAAGLDLGGVFKSQPPPPSGDTRTDGGDAGRKQQQADGGASEPVETHQEAPSSDVSAEHLARGAAGRGPSRGGQEVGSGAAEPVVNRQGPEKDDSGPWLNPTETEPRNVTAPPAFKVSPAAAAQPSISSSGNQSAASQPEKDNARTAPEPGTPNPPATASQPEGDGRRGLQGDGAPLCITSTMSPRSDAVNAECCDTPQEDCSSGHPTVCDSGCAAVLLPFVRECRYLFPADERDAFKDTVQLCTAIRPGTGTSDPTLPVRNCTDSTTWRGEHGQGCGQYALGTATTWHRTCEIDGEALPTEAVADSADMFGFAVMARKAAEACRVSCSTCPTCEDRIQNGDEAGVDCGGSCLVTCDPDSACEPFAQSGLVPANAEAVCTGGAGVAAGDVCHIVARTGFITASVGAAAAACSDRECEELAPATVMVPPIHVTPGEYICTFGKWVGYAVPLLPIVATSCPGVIKENHYSGSCPAGSGTCQATCDAGYRQVGGDGVFSW